MSNPSKESAVKAEVVLIWMVVGLVGVILLLACGLASVGRHVEEENGTALLWARNIDAVLYMESAEYAAATEQAYAWATERLKQKLDANPKDPAVVMDLDETVFDNHAFQKELIQEKAEYTEERWNVFEKEPKKVKLIPGAKRFIDFAAANKVKVYYITNRTNRDGAEAALKELGIPFEKEELLEKIGKSSDKTGRRKEVEKKASVLLYVGDNLRDFSEDFKFDEKAGIEKRMEVVASSREKFGKEWIIIPNPMYGEWTAPFRGKAGIDYMMKK